MEKIILKSVLVVTLCFASSVKGSPHHHHGNNPNHPPDNSHGAPPPPGFQPGYSAPHGAPGGYSQQPHPSDVGGYPGQHGAGGYPGQPGAGGYPGQPGAGGYPGHPGPGGTVVNNYGSPQSGGSSGLQTALIAGVGGVALYGALKPSETQVVYVNNGTAPAAASGTTSATATVKPNTIDCSIYLHLTTLAQTSTTMASTTTSVSTTESTTTTKSTTAIPKTLETTLPTMMNSTESANCTGDHCLATTTLSSVSNSTSNPINTTLTTTPSTTITTVTTSSTSTSTTPTTMTIPPECLHILNSTMATETVNKAVASPVSASNTNPHSGTSSSHLELKFIGIFTSMLLFISFL